MPDLKPDMSVFTRPQTMDPGSVVGLMGRMQEIEGKQSMTESLNEATNKETGETDFDKASAIRATKGGFFRPPMQTN